jgi:hypothetical protein
VQCDGLIALMSEVSSPKFMEPSQTRMNAPRAGPWTIFPVIKWKFDALWSVTEPEPAA